MKQEYIEYIMKMLESCDDLSLLDLIDTLLRKVGTES